MTRRYLLSIDGGGIRGIIPLCALIKLEQTTGRLTRESFSLVAGTSTGAIIAAGVAAGVPADQMLQLYFERLDAVFPRRPWHVVKRIIFGWMYSAENLRDLFANELGAAREWTLNDSEIDLLITARHVTDGQSWYFVRDKPGQNACRTGHLSLVDCVIASSVAPTFFPPWTIDGIGPLVDGGVGVTGNPVYQACVEAFYYTGEYTPEETTIVSLGTGRFSNRERPTWIWPWINWILAELLRSPGEQQTELIYRHFPEVPFYRIDTELARDIPMDDAAGAHELRAHGESLANLIDWEAILEGSDQQFRVTTDTSLARRYRISER